MEVVGLDWLFVVGVGARGLLHVVVVFVCGVEDVYVRELYFDWCAFVECWGARVYGGEWVMVVIVIMINVCDLVDVVEMLAFGGCFLLHVDPCLCSIIFVDVHTFVECELWLTVSYGVGEVHVCAVLMLLRVGVIFFVDLIIVCFLFVLVGDAFDVHCLGVVLKVVVLFWV